MEGNPADDAELLLAVFRFKNQQPSVTQTDAFCKQLRHALGVVVSGIIDKGNLEACEAPQVGPAAHLDPLQDDRGTPLDQFTAQERIWLGHGWRQLYSKPSSEIGAVWTLAWFPQYAGVLQAEQLGVETVVLRVVALDKWEWTSHFLSSGECVHSAVATKHIVFSCGSVAVASLQEVLCQLASVLAEAKQCSGNKRSAAFSRNERAGHQKTPQFLVASVRTALDKTQGRSCSRAPHLPRGGMTDVGLHTGGSPRDTCWSLVCAALRQSLPPHCALADKLLLAFYGELLERKLTHWFEPDTLSELQNMESFWRHVDLGFGMLEVVALRVAVLVDRGYDGRVWLTAIQRQRVVLDDVVKKWNQASATTYRLPLQPHNGQPPGFPKLSAPDQTLFRDLPTDHLGDRGTAWSSMGRAYEFIDADADSVVSVLAFLDSVTTQDRVKILFGLRSTERYLFKISSQLEMSSASAAKSIDPEQLVNMMTWYRDHLPTDHCGDDLVRVQQQSVYLLLSWIVFCLAHSHCCDAFPDVAQHRIALDWQRLDVCVLDERVARVALQRVARYIHDWNERVRGHALFDLTNQKGTLELAQRMGSLLHEETYRALHKQWLETCEATWSTVLRRKDALRIVRQEITEYEAEKREANRNLAQEEARLQREGKSNTSWYLPSTSNATIKAYNSNIRRLKNLIHQKRGKCDRLNNMPEFGVCSVPREKASALQLLFLVAPPKRIDLLAELCWRAQRALSLQAVASLSPGSTSWRQHVDRYSRGIVSAPAEHAIVFPNTLDVPNSFGPSTIDAVSSLESFMSSCTWYPSLSGSSLWWRNHGAWVNPFDIAAATSRKHFTARVPRGAAGFDWQWAVTYPIEESLVRGNTTYAHWGKSPEEFEKEIEVREFCSRGAVRGYPMQQLRRVFADIEADTLQWSDPTVSLLVRHALYQVGELRIAPTVPDDGETATNVRLVWHEDLESGAGVGDFCEMMRRLATKLDHSPRRWRCVRLVSAVAGFLSQYRSDARAVVQMLARTTRRWAEEVRASWRRDGVASEERQELRTRECVMYGYAVLCFHRHHAHLKSPATTQDGDGDGDDTCLEMCELLILFHNAKLFASGAEIQAIRATIDRMMLDCVADVAKLVQASPHRSQLLTRLCRLVDTAVPEHLMWSIAPPADGQLMSCCFVALDDATQTQYFINLFSGAVVTNGSLPRALPDSIRRLPRYKQLFNDKDFEVVCRNGVYTVTTPNRQCYRYAFHIVQETEELLVEEYGPDWTLQLCSRVWCERFARVFPRQLAELYSHWYWVERQVVLLRATQASNPDVHFIVQFTDDGTALCFEISRSDRALHYDRLLQQLSQYPVFMLPDAQLRTVFGKFESHEFVHVMRFVDPLKSQEIRLPRVGLRFVQDQNGRLASMDHRGFVLCNVQQLSGGQMPRFFQYLVLERDSNTSNRRVLIPTGPVKLRSDGLVVVEVSNEASASIPCAAIDEHPRLGVFAPDTIEARLQLAAIYAASGSLLPWHDLGMTGGEAALQMLRGCVPSRPFCRGAEAHLVAIATRFAYRSPVLTLMVALLLEKSSRLAFLFDGGVGKEVGETTQPTVDIGDALDEYRNRLGDPWAALVYPSRQLLTVKEERDLLGASNAVETIHARTYTSQATCSVDLDNDGVASSEVAVLLEASVSELESLCSPKENRSSPASSVLPAFPLSLRGSNTMSEHMMSELRESWDAFHRHNAWASLAVSRDIFRIRVRDQLTFVQAKLKDVWQILEQSLECARSSVRDKLLETIGRHAPLTLADVMQSVLDENLLLGLSPQFSAVSRARWKQWSLQLLELCVLEDKLERMLHSDASDTKILEELETIKRAWSPMEHPYWLVFEVEGRLQIRHEQFVVASHLIENPGSICQLNMGRGKTRVILPMLFLYYSYRARGCLSTMQDPNQRATRAHFLSPLLSETREFMWRVLSSGVLALPFIELPFNRNVSLGLCELRMMCHVVAEAKRHGAVVIVAPEHRLSLELKRVEMKTTRGSGGADNANGDAADELLDSVLHPDHFVDVFDESDALLHDGYHLVYAVGESVSLDGGSDRWLTAEALLRVLVSETSTRVQHVLQSYRDLWSDQPEYRKRSGGRGHFNGFRLNTTTAEATSGGGEGDDVARAALRLALVEDLMDHAPFDCEWLRLFSRRSSRSAREALIRILTDATIDLHAAIERLPAAILHRKHQVLALRGLLAFAVLENCLEKRYRVEYGHPLPGTRPKAIAIPYQAADLPSERSEFSHPDVGIVLTLLSFYHSGLRDDQLRRAFEVLLLDLDPSESARYYREWFASIAKRWPLDEQDGQDDRRVYEMLANLQHISLDNAHQFAVVCDAYRFSIEVANFYLNFCVFPSDTRQFPRRLARSAWDLVRGTTNVGFSGTNDTHHLLPLAVTQREPNEPALRGTNGKMIQLLFEATRGYECMATAQQQHQKAETEAHGSKSGSGSAVACWQALLLLALQKSCHALIDTGALLAGVSNHEAARFLLAQSLFAFQGVTYYDTRAEFDGWVVLEKHRNLVQRHKHATLCERDTFVVFDEARARGSDMKLLPRAVALLTLGPRMTKDKLMQGAGRLRQLGAEQQTLWITSTLDVYKSITRHLPNTSHDVSVAHILNWVVDNTQRQCTLGHLEWAQSGIEFHAKEIDATREEQEEDWTLEGQYAGAQRETLISEIIRIKLSAQLEREVSSSTTTLCASSGETAWHAIGRQGDVFGSQDKVSVSGFGEECEREMQIEEEQYEEREIVYHNVAPCPETAWQSWKSLLRASSVADLQRLPPVAIVSLEQAVHEWFLPRECREIHWTCAKIYATQNFWSTTTAASSSTGSDKSSFVWNSCLRRVDAMVVFADASVLLLSEFEADAVLKMLHSKRVDRQHAGNELGQMLMKHGGSFGVVHLAFCVGFLDRLKAPSSPLEVRVSQIPVARGWSRGKRVVPGELRLPFSAIVVCRLLNGDTDLFVESHAAASETTLRELMRPLRHRESTLQSFITLRGFTARWKRSFLHTIAKRMDTEDLVG